MNHRLAGDPIPGSPQAAALGLALAARFGHWQTVMEERVAAADGPRRVLPPDFHERELLTRQYATMLIGRWLVSGTSASEDESRWISEQGRVAAGSGLPIMAVGKHYLHWRDVTTEFLEQLGSQLGTSETVLAAARRVVRASADASLLRLLRDYDDEVRRLRRLLDEERSSLRHQALHDQMTGIPNRALFYDRLGQALATFRRDEAPFAIMLLDLDRFKEINDTLGHQAGDRVLQHVAGQLRPVLRQVDTLARLGGDEFGAILPGAGLPEARAIRERLEEALGNPLRVGDATLLVKASMGIACCPHDGRDEETLLRQADVELYARKRGDRGMAGAA